MDGQTVTRILQAYKVPYVAVDVPQKGYRNYSYPVTTSSGESLNLIIYKAEPNILARIKNANALGNFLHTAGFPARRTADSRILQMKSTQQTRYASLYYYLPGHTIPWEDYTMDHIKLLGKTLSDMHSALLPYEGADLPDVADEYLVIVENMRRYFSDIQVQKALVEKLLLDVDIAVFEQFKQLLIGTRLLPGKQPLHMDFVRSNILFSDVPHDDALSVSIAGILDFEKAAFGHPLFDIARTLAFLTVDCKRKEPHKVRKYFLGSGYIKRGAAILPAKHVDLLDALVDMFLFYDFYKFLKHNPYESLPDNEHFIRTAQMLMPKKYIYPGAKILAEKSL
jgi:Ser/Thr protein kinase RdoA (MazF antagonist)